MFLLVEVSCARSVIYFFSTADSSSGEGEMQKLIYNITMSAEQVALCTPILPLKLSDGILVCQNATTLVFTSFLPPGVTPPKQDEAMGYIIEQLNLALQQHSDDKTPPSSQQHIQRAPQFGPITGESDGSQDDR